MLSLFLVLWSVLCLFLHIAFAAGLLPGNVYLVVAPICVALATHLLTLRVTHRWSAPNPHWSELRRAWGVAAFPCSALYVYVGICLLYMGYLSVGAPKDQTMSPQDLQKVGAIFAAMSAAWSMGNWGVLRLPPR